MKKLYENIKNLEGNVLCIEIQDKKIMDVLKQNRKISVYELNRTQKKGLFKKNKKVKIRSGKSINIKKFRKMFKKKSIEYMIINIDNLLDYYKFIASNSIYICNTKIYFIGKNEYVDGKLISKLFKRYNTCIENVTINGEFLTIINVEKAKYSFLKEKLYLIVDTIYNVGEMISYILTS